MKWMQYKLFSIFSKEQGNLKNKTAIVTGSTSSIGLETIRLLAENGANVVMNGIKDDSVDENIKKLESMGVKAVFNGANLMDENECAKLIEDTVKEFGSVDILVNNAGIQHISPIQRVALLFPLYLKESQFHLVHRCI
jgi:3-hydroxybutyrate dehydrogenase